MSLDDESSVGKELEQVVSTLESNARFVGLGKTVRVEIAVFNGKRGLRVEHGEIKVFFSADVDSLEVLVRRGRQLLKRLAESNALERYRLFHGLSFEELAERLDYSVARTRAYCQETRQPDATERSHIAQATNGQVSVESEWSLLA